MHAKRLLGALLFAPVLVLFQWAEGTAQTSPQPQTVAQLVSAPVVNTVSGGCQHPFYCGDPPGPCDPYGSANPPWGVESVECEEWKDCVPCWRTEGPVIGEAINTIWLAVVEGHETPDWLDNVMREYGAVATLNFERNSIQVRAASCGGLVANIPLTLKLADK
jgi:hypothetical protein